MYHYFTQQEIERIPQARESFSGRILTDPQFEEAIAIVGIVKREILRSGAFKEKLGDYAYALARTNQFDAMKGESIVRDLFKTITGQSMNQMRENLVKREEKLPTNAKSMALDHANAVGTMIRQGTKINFNRAFAHEAEAMATNLGITDAGAKRLMKEEFKAAGNGDLYEWGKQVEEQFYKPQIEAEKNKGQEKAEKDHAEERAADNDRSRPPAMQYRR